MKWDTVSSVICGSCWTLCVVVLVRYDIYARMRYKGVVQSLKVRIANGCLQLYVQQGKHTLCMRS